MIENKTIITKDLFINYRLLLNYFLYRPIENLMLIFGVLLMVLAIFADNLYPAIISAIYSIILIISSLFSKIFKKIRYQKRYLNNYEGYCEVNITFDLNNLYIKTISNYAITQLVVKYEAIKSVIIGSKCLIMQISDSENIPLAYQGFQNDYEKQQIIAMLKRRIKDVKVINI